MRLGIDLGGSKIEIIALDDEGRELLRERVATPQGDYHGTLAAIRGLVDGAEHLLGRRGSVGIGIPGTISHATGLVKNANSTCLIGQPLLGDLQRLLGRQVRLANDANCFALSEAVDGAGSGATTVFGVILGTGVGGGIVVGGRVVEGANGIAGEWGHNPMPRNPHSAMAVSDRADSQGEMEPLCYCGRRGCVETYLSGPGMAADHLRATGSALTPEEIVARARTGDHACEAALQRYEERLAHALAQVINVLDPDVIVLGGGLSNLDRLYESVPRHWGSAIFSDTVVTRLLKHRHGDSSGVRGAAALWPAGV